MSDFSSVPLVALCGRPKVGKSTVQRLMTEMFGFTPVDDGRVLRDNAIRMFGLTEWHVTTHEGKDSYVEVCGHPWQVRQILGDLGQLYEDHFGENVLAEIALKDAAALHADPARFHLGFTFGSVRKYQGWAYKAHGGVVIEVASATRGIDSPYDFDWYDSTVVDATIWNNGDEEELRANLAALTDRFGWRRVGLP